MKLITEKYEVVIIGGGLAGVIAALSSARTGARTVIVQNRPVFGGNASSEIKMHICGASMHGKRHDARETGILDEILMENKQRNPHHSFYIFDAILWEKVNLQENLDYHLNTHFFEALSNNQKIESVKAMKLNAETILTIKGDIFIDATGDGSVSADAGESFYFGRDDNKLYTKEDDNLANGTMGNSVMYSSRTEDVSEPHTNFKVATGLTAKELKNRFGFDDPGNSVADEAAAGFWWNELGGEKNTIYDSEEINHDILKNLFGIYNYVKNSEEMESEHNTIDWIGFLPGKRESRRIKCKYQLTESDLQTNTKFPDVVGYGGWSMDMHNPLGFIDHQGEPTNHIFIDEVYQIPLRSMIPSYNHNLLVTGRLIDTDSMAFSSTRVMGTCAVIGQAVGVVASLLIANRITTRDVDAIISQVQSQLIEDGCYLPGLRLNSRFTATDFEGSQNPILFNGETRGRYIDIEDGIVDLKLKDPAVLNQMIIYFDNDLTSEVMPTITRSHKMKQSSNMPPCLVKDFNLTIEYVDGYKQTIECRENVKREYHHKFELNNFVEKVKLQVIENYGADRITLSNIYIK